jgi:hypothetical protein
MANAPSLRCQLSGTSITTFDITSTWTLSNKSEKIYTLSVSDGSQTLDLSNVPNIKLLIFYSETDFICTFNQNDSVSESIPFVIDGGIPFILGTTEDFIASLDSIQISTTSTTEQDIFVNVYGEEASS